MSIFRKRIIFIGDVHGHFDELTALLEKIGYNSTNDRLILLGDLVDRGPKSKEVVTWARTNNVECVRGNHDQRYLDIRKKIKWHEENPGQTKPSILKNKEKMNLFHTLSEEDLNWIASLPIFIRIPEIRTIAVHAGIEPGVEPEKCDINTMMHIRFLFEKGKPAFLDRERGFITPEHSYFWADKYNLDWNVVYGHHVWNMTSIKQHEGYYGHICYGIDTGVCFGGRLTAMIVNNVPEKNELPIEYLQPTFEQVDYL